MPISLIQRDRAEHLFAVDIIDHFADDFFDRIEIGFRLQSIGDAVEFAPGELGIIVFRIVLVVLEADGRDQTMRHQRARR